MNPDLNTIESGDPHLSVTGQRNGLSGGDVCGWIDGGTECLERTVDVVVLLGVGIVGVEAVGQDNALQPLDGFESVGVWNEHTRRSTALSREPLAIELVTQEDRILAGWIFEHPADGKRALEPLLGIVVVIAVVKNSSYVRNGFRHPDHVA